MAWSIISPLMPFITQDIQISASICDFPVILGSVLRVPFGYLTNIIGAKWVFLAVLLFCYFLYSFGTSTKHDNAYGMWLLLRVGVQSSQ